jgi:hypothetical protein
MADTTINLPVLQQRLFASAKRWFGGALAMRIGAVVAGLLSLVPEAGRFAPFIVFLLTAVAEAVSLRSDRLKSLAERTLRVFEISNGLGTPPPETQVADIAAEAPSSVASAALTPTPDLKPYFAAGSEPGPLRLLQNLQESSWWTKHLARTMYAAVVVVMTALAALSVVLLVVSVNVAVHSGTLGVISRVVTASLMLVFSLGMFRMAVGYGSLRDRATAAEARALATLSKEPDVVTALRILHEYQLARAAAPLLPDWVYRWRRDGLNALRDAKVSA